MNPMIINKRTEEIKMTALEAAEKVLSESKKPMTIKEITRTILRTGIWTTKSKKPENTIVSKIYILT